MLFFHAILCTILKKNITKYSNSKSLNKLLKIYLKITKVMLCKYKKQKSKSFDQTIISFWHTIIFAKDKFKLYTCIKTHHQNEIGNEAKKKQVQQCECILRWYIIGRIFNHFELIRILFLADSTNDLAMTFHKSCNSIFSHGSLNIFIMMKKSGSSKIKKKYNNNKTV